MKILYVSQWFDPEPILKGRMFAEGLAAEGDEVEVVTGFPSYPLGRFYDGWVPSALETEEHGRITVHRVLSYPSRDQSAVRRTLTYLSFAVAACVGVVVRRRAWDVVYAYHPPISIMLPALLAARMSGASLVLDVQDLWPDTLRATSMVGGGWFYRLVGRVCEWLYRRADRIVVLSEGFRAALVDRGVPAEKIHVIHNWSRFDTGDEPDASAPGPAGGDASEFEILYAGAIGPAQGLDVVLDAAEQVEGAEQVDGTEPRGRRVVFRLLGEGIEKARLEAEADERGIGNVEFLEGVGVEAARRRMLDADAVLIHLRPDPLFEITVPSKVQDCLSIGRPIVAGVRGAARRLLEQSGGAVLFEPGDAAGLAAAARTLEGMDSRDLSSLSANSRAFYHGSLSLAKGLNETRAVLSDATDAGGGAG